MPRKNNRQPAILKALENGGDAPVIAEEFGVTPSYVYRLDKQRRGKGKTDVMAVSGAPALRPMGDLFVQKSVSALIRHGGDIAEDYLRELNGYSATQLYKEMGNNPVIAATLSAIKMTLRRVKWFASAENDKQDDEAKDYLESCIHDMSVSFSDHIDQALSMMQYGFAPFEVVYKLRRGFGLRPGPRTPRSRYDDGRIGWKKISLIGQDTLAQGQSWIFSEDGSLRGLNQRVLWNATSARGAGVISIPIEKMVLYRTTTERDNPEGKSVLRAMYGPWYYAKNLEEIEAIATERMGAGFPTFYLGEDVSKGTASDAEIHEYRKMARNIRIDEQMGLVIPHKKMGTGNSQNDNGVLFEFTSPMARSGVDFGAIIQRYEKRMAMVGLAQFIHLGMDNIGSQALADVTTDFFQLAVAAWADSIKDTINRFLVDPLFILNSEFRIEDHPIIDHSDISTPDLSLVADYINKTVGAQVITPDDRLEESVRRVAGLPSKEEATARRVMNEIDGEGGQRVARGEKAKPADAINQRNQSPKAEKPQEPKQAEVDKPRRA